MSPQHPNLLTLLLASLTLLTLVSAATLPHPNPISLLSPTLKSSNSSTLTIPIDRRFSIDKGATGRPLDPTACKMVALQFMGELALLDWETSFAGAHSPLTVYPSVFIYGGAAQATSRTRSKYLIWGLVLVMGEFIRSSRFEEVRYDLIFEGQRVGVLHFQGVRSGPGGVEALSATEKVALRESGEGSRVGEEESQAAALNVTNHSVRIRPNLIAGAQRLDPDHVWLALYATMQTLAFPDKNTILIEPFTLTPVHTNIKILITSHHGSETPRHWPPFLLYWVIIQALKQLPSWLLSPQGDFKETVFGIFDGDVFLGGGWCRWGWRPDPLTMGSGLNVSAS